MAYIGVERVATTSAADTAQTISAGGGAAGSADGVKRRVISVFISYSAAPTQTGITITLNSGAGAAFDNLLIQGSANIRYTYWSPSEELILMGDDTLDVVSPAAGGVITGSVLIITEGYYGSAA